MTYVTETQEVGDRHKGSTGTFFHDKIAKYWVIATLYEIFFVKGETKPKRFFSASGEAPSLVRGKGGDLRRRRSLARNVTASRYIVSHDTRSRYKLICGEPTPMLTRAVHAFFKTTTRTLEHHARVI